MFVFKVDKTIDKKIVSDKTALFAPSEPTLHYIKVAEDTDEYLQVWVKAPTWLEVDKAINNLGKIDAKSQNLHID